MTRGSEAVLSLLRRLRGVDSVLFVVCLAVASTQAAWAIVVPVLPAYAAEFGANATELGLLVALFGIGRLVVNIPAGMLSNRFDPRKLLIGAVLGVVAFQAASAFAPTFEVLLLLRLATGLAGGMAITCGMVLIAELTSSANRGQAMSVLQGVQLVGGALGPALGGLVATFWGSRAPFLACGLMAALVVVFGSRTLLRSPLVRPASDTTRTEKPDSRSAVRRLLTDRSYLAVCAVAFSVFFNRFAGTQSLVPIIAYTVVGLSVGQFGGLLGAVTVLNLVMVSLSGRLSDRIGRKRVIVPGLLVAALALPVYAISDNVALFVATTIVTGLALGFSGPTPAAYVADLAPEDGRGPAVGIYRTFGDLAAVVGPVLLGWLVDHTGYQSAVLVLAGVMLSVAVLFAAVARETVVRRSRRDSV